MRNTFVILSLLFFTALADSASAAPNPAFCSRTRDDVFKILLDPTMRLSFENDGGLADGGVCWWHARFQRLATYLVIYRPDLPKPTEKEAAHLVYQIRWMSHVVEIPGYSNLADFSRDFKDVIQHRLNDWQIFDAFVNQAWIIGLKGHYTVSAAKFQSIMDDLYQQVKSSDLVLFDMLQFQGIDAHAWLVAGMEKTSDGYAISIVDSNFPTQNITYNYHHGDQDFIYPDQTQFVPYISFNADLRRIERTISDYCH